MVEQRLYLPHIRKEWEDVDSHIVFIVFRFTASGRTRDFNVLRTFGWQQATMHGYSVRPVHIELPRFGGEGAFPMGNLLNRRASIALLTLTLGLTPALAGCDGGVCCDVGHPDPKGEIRTCKGDDPVENHVSCTFGAPASSK